MNTSDLRQFDPRAPETRKQRRYCCPNCHGDRPFDAAHRSLVVDSETGAYICHRCNARGRLDDYRSDTPSPRRMSRAALSASNARRLASVDLSPGKPRELDRSRLDQYQAATLTAPGAQYLRSRGLDPDLAAATGIRSTSDWYGRPAVLFPLRDRSGELVAIQGRYTDNREPKCRSTSGTGEAVFRAGDPAGVVAIVEGPLDALALWSAGLPAIALIGATAPGWLTRSLRGSILIATDADERGDRAATEIRRALRVDPVRIARLRPASKDFAEDYQRDPRSMEYRLRALALDPRRTLDPLTDTIGDQALTVDDVRISAIREMIDAGGPVDLIRIAVALIEDSASREFYRYRIQGMMKGEG